MRSVNVTERAAFFATRVKKAFCDLRHKSLGPAHHWPRVRHTRRFDKLRPSLARQRVVGSGRGFVWDGLMGAERDKKGNEEK